MTTSPVMGITEEILGEIERAGWKLVPERPTKGMRAAFHDSYERYEEGMGECPDSQWRAMLAAAPPPEYTAQEGKSHE